MIKEIAYGGWSKNLLVTGQEIELVITLEVGPRIIRLGFPEGKNVFAKFPEQMGKAGESDWQIRGGHRLWTAPEADHSYEPDNGPVSWKALGNSAVEVTQPAGSFGFQKAIRVEILEGDLVKVTHLLTNVSQRDLDITPWILSVMAPGGFALIPQPRIDLHPSEFPTSRAVKPVDFWPNREIVLWPFTNLTDGRYAFSRDFLRLTYQKELPATKLGLKLPTGWVAYANEGQVFAKHFTRLPGVPYPDAGVNFEIFSNPEIVELESLAPALPLTPNETREHIEYLVLKRNAGDLRQEDTALSFFATLPKL